MRKRLSLFMSGALSSVLVLPMSASADILPTPQRVQRAKTADVRVAAAPVRQNLLTEELPQVFSPEKRGFARLYSPADHATFQSAVQRYAPAKSAMAVKDVTLYGNIIYSKAFTTTANYGVYSFPAVSGLEVTPVALSSDMQGMGGALYANGMYYFNYYMQDAYGTIYVIYYALDATTWDQAYGYYTYTHCIATDLTYDYTTDKAYGCFYTDDLAGFTFGTMDLSTGLSTAIASLDTRLVGLAANAAGEVYGITLTGKLIKINKATGAYTEIGATGVTPGSYAQSASFDSRTGKLFWAAMNVSGVSELYEVNTTTGAASLISVFPNNEQIAGLYSMGADAEEGAPAAIEDLAVRFDGGALSGTIDFTLPTKSYSDATLSDEALTYHVIINGDVVVADQTGAPGSQVATPVSVADHGEYTIVVTTSNSVGTSPKAMLTSWIGIDQPKPVSGLTLVNDSLNHTVALTWTAPTAGAHGAYFDAGLLTYKVVRQPAGVVVAEGLTATTFSESLNPEEMAAITYDVMAHAGTWDSEPTSTRQIVVGDYLVTPVALPISTQDNFNLFTVVDNNADGKTWTFAPAMPAARYSYSGANPADDWLITPAIHMKSDREYILRYQVANHSLGYNEHFDVAMGVGATAAAMTTQIQPKTEVSNAILTYYENVIHVEEEGNYNIGFHACSKKDIYYLYVDSITVVDGAVKVAPAAVGNFTVTPGAEGALNATITFDAPSTNGFGAPLTALNSASIYRDGELLHTFDAPALGATLSYTDAAVGQGSHIYTAFATSDLGDGSNSTDTVYVGVDIPTEPIDVTVAINNGKVVLFWDAPEGPGANGGYVDNESLTYYIWRLTDDSRMSTTSTSYVDNTIDLNGEQYGLSYGVWAVSPTGEGAPVQSNVLLVGENYTLPFDEHFAGGACSYFWGVWGNTDAVWKLYTNTNNFVPDGDTGFAAFGPFAEGEQSRLYSGKLSLAGSTNPVLSYYTCIMPSKTLNHDSLYVEISVDGDEYEVIQKIDFADYDFNDEMAWTRFTCPLADYVGASYVSIAFRGVCAAKGVDFYIDAVNVKDVHNYDLVASDITAPTKIKVGESGDVVVSILNDGQNEASDYTVDLYRGTTYISSVPGVKIASGATETVTFSVVPDITYGDRVLFSAYVNYAADQDKTSNTTSTVACKIAQPILPAVGDLEGRMNDGTATLSWSEPETSVAEGVETTETFDDYAPFIISNVGDWTMHDVNGSATYVISDSNGNPMVGYDNASAAMAFMVFNPYTANIGTIAASFPPHSGNQMMAAFNDEDGLDDDWLITPALSGAAQTIKFFARSAPSDYGLEELECYYSTGNTDVTSFTKIEGVTKNVPDTWTEYSVSMPAGAKYFAIRCVSADHFALFIDDVTYMAAPETFNVSLLGYNIYRNGTKINAAIVEEPTYSEPLSEQATYTVTAVYNFGESAASNAVELPVSGIESITMDAESHGAIYDAMGRKVTTIHAGGIYLQDGKKFITK